MAMVSVLDRIPRWGWAVGVGMVVLFSGSRISERFRRKEAARRRKLVDDLVVVVFTNERSSRADDVGVPMDRFTSEHVQRIVEYVDRARVSVYLGMYIMTVDSIGEALIRAKRRGVRVRVIGCSSMSYSSGSQMSKLAEEDITIRFNDTSSAYLMHHKFCLIDTDWLCPRCYHEERVRRLGFCCDRQQQPVASGLPEGHAMAAANGSGGGLVANGGAKVVRCDLANDAKGCERCRSEKLAKKEELLLVKRSSGNQTEPLPVGGIIITGSSNWTMQALNGNWDNMIITSLEAIVVPFQVEFQRLWAEFARSRKIMAATTATVGEGAGGLQQQ